MDHGSHVEQVGIVPQTEGELQVEHLVVGKTTPRERNLRKRARKMDAAKRPGKRHQGPT